MTAVGKEKSPWRGDGAFAECPKISYRQSVPFAESSMQNLGKTTRLCREPPRPSANLRSICRVLHSANRPEPPIFLYFSISSTHHPKHRFINHNRSQTTTYIDHNVTCQTYRPQFTIVSQTWPNTHDQVRNICVTPYFQIPFKTVKINFFEFSKFKQNSFNWKGRI